MRGKCQRAEAADGNDIKSNSKSPRCMDLGLFYALNVRKISG